MSVIDAKLGVLPDMMAALGQPPLSQITPQQFRDMRARSRNFLNPPTAPVAIIRDETVARRRLSHRIGALSMGRRRRRRSHLLSRRRFCIRRS